MKTKIPTWLLLAILVLIFVAYQVENRYGVVEQNKNEEILLDRVDSLQRIVDSFNTCYKWNNEKHNYDF